MKKMLLVFVILFLVGWIVTDGLLALRHRSADGLSRQALEAYNRGDYAGALPLFKKWGQTPEVRKDAQQMQIVVAYITDIQNRLARGTATAGPADQNQLTQQALAIAEQEQRDLADPAHRVPHRAPVAGEVREMYIKDLGNFGFEPTTDTTVPEDVQALNGMRVRLIGYMQPINQASDVSEFALLPSLYGCCGYAQPPGVQHVVSVHMDGGKTVDYTLDEVEVEGILRVGIKRQDGYSYSIFELAGSSAKIREATP